jgi:peptidoglycan/LPS O-acetylase OafA/YrhL
LKYRAEIDGLRALAIVPVILFHAGFEIFRGGFVGVDVFFVISGYLITTILIEDIEANRFSLLGFYERRARRILPALFFVMMVCLPFSWMWMLPSQMEGLSKSFIAVSLFASNILFWREDNRYFDGTDEDKPLLHTWSLAVEEQYYVLFPIFFFLAWRYGKNRVFWMIVVMTSISFLLSEWGWRNKAININIASFYLAPTRAWELFSGSIAAFIVHKRGVRKNDALSLLGLAAIIFSIFVYDESTPFPSIYTLVPVAGVVLLVLFAEKESLVARILSTKAFVGIGLISYSAFLWHQPLFAFVRIRLLHEPSDLLMIILSGSSLLLAVASWRYVEKPFRQKFFLKRKYIFLISLGGIVTFICMGLAGNLNNGFAKRLSDKDIIFESALINDVTKLFIESEQKNSFSDDGRKKILIIGDSFAKDFLEAVSISFGENLSQLDLVFLNVPRRCKNVLANNSLLFDSIFRSDKHCLKKENRIGNKEWDNLISGADLVVVRSFWDILPTYEMANTYDYADALNPGSVIFIGSTIFGRDLAFKGLVGLKTIEPLTYSYGIKNVWPEYNGFAERLNDRDITFPNKPKSITSYDLIQQAKVIMRERNYFDVFDFFCDHKKCLIVDANRNPLTNDLLHLTSSGESVMMKKLFQNKKFLKIWMDNIGILLANK